MRRKIVAGNWKMNMNFAEGVALFSEIVNMASDEIRKGQELIVCPPFFFLPTFVQLSKSVPGVSIGAQNLYSEAGGAFTGEISAEQLASTGVQYVILGHSERRMYFNEDEFQLSKKIQLALSNGLKPIYCVGENLEERESGDFLKIVGQQLREVLSHLPSADMPKVVIAYEPVWAIGTGLTASPQQAQEVHAYIRECLSNLFDAKTSLSTSVLYGGSCNPGNAQELFSMPDIDGGLIGGASLKSRDFLEIAKVFNQ